MVAVSPLFMGRPFIIIATTIPMGLLPGYTLTPILSEVRLGQYHLDELHVLPLSLPKTPSALDPQRIASFNPSECINYENITRAPGSRS